MTRRGSPEISTGPSSTIAAVTGAAVVMVTTSGSAEAVQLVALITVLAGLLYIALALLKMGWISNFLSESVLTGFIFGIGTDVVIGQLGLNIPTTILGISLLALLILLKLYAPKVPGALVAVVLGIGAATVFSVADEGAERRVAARYRWDRLIVSFWFAPALMALGAVLFAWSIYWVDGLIPNETLQDSRLVLSGTVGERSTALLSIATTVLATAGVVFTLLTLPLSTVAAQYGSRLLRLFLGDRTAQFVLGMFVATFFYCIAAPFSILPVEVEPDGPQLTATAAGFSLMLATFATLILLVQHISTMLQAPNIAVAAGAELHAVVRAAYLEDVTDGGCDWPTEERANRTPRVAQSRQSHPGRKPGESLDRD